MKNGSLIIFILALLLAPWERAAAQGLSNKGRDFWVGYGHHQFMETGANTQEMVLYFSAEAQAATVTVSVPGTPWFRTYNVPANTVISTELTVPTAGFPGPLAAAPIPKSGTYDFRLYTVPCGFVPPGTACGGEGLFTNRGIHIVSDVPIVAYAHIYGSASSGATMLMPVETWGYSYVTLNSKQEYAANCFSWAYVIAQNDNTVVEITPSQTTRFPRAANVPFTVTLNRGEIYQIMAGPETGSTKPEFSGTKFKSIANAAGNCYPIAVFAGSSRTSNPMACGSGGGDNDNQQCFPSQAWGKRYLTAPTSSSTGAANAMTNSYKIAVKDPLTNVFRNGTQIPLGTLQSNSYYYFESNQPELITADKPVMVAQFMTGGTGCTGSGTSDPEMMYISPVEQGIKRIGFFRNNRQAITINYLTLIIPTPGLTSLLIDGSSTFDHVYAHPRLAGYSIVIKRWSGAQSQATASSDSAFTAITYGLGGVESYGYNAGTLINNLNAVGSIFNVSDTSTTTTSHPFTCTNTPVKLSVLLGYPTPPTRLVWRLSTVGGGLTPNADVTDNAPTPTGTQMVNGVLYSKYELPGTFTFSTVGTYRIPILATHPTIENCNNTEEVFYNIEVKGKPSTNFNITHTGCVLDTVFFTGQTVSANGFNLNQWRYTFPDATVANSKDTAKLFAAPGTHNVNLRVVSTEGCVGDTIKQVVIYPKPTASFTVADPTVCVGAAISVTPTSTYTGTPGVINSYYWDFGDGTTYTVATNAPQTHTYTTYGTYQVKHVAGVSNLCVSDTAVQTVTIYARPTTSFTYPAGCLPANGTVQFTSTATTPDGQVITGHLWTFGDPPSGPANTSTLANPTHTYPGFGNYTITYQTTTANGCFKDTTVNATFNLAPSFTYPPLPPVCGNSGGTVNVATATVTNGVPGTGVYSGPGTTPAGIFDPAIAGAGTWTIWYVYTATSGCRDSISSNITVAAAPQANFSFSPNGCLPANGQVNFTYTGTAQTGQTYLWNFGDPASGANNSSTLANPTHIYSAGTYQIILQVTNPSTGCVKRDTINQTFNVTPALTYPPLAAVCENLSSVNVATATVTNGVTGTGVYSGSPAVSASGVFNPSVAGPGPHTITYTFTSAAGNCVATTNQTIVVNAKPNASFTYPTAACLPSSGVANFTYNGSMSAGQTYLWNFGDPASGANNTSTLQNPSHTYTNTGIYSVSVTVTNSNGCVDDSVINNITFSVTPALSYPALAAVCNNVAPYSIANATVTNGVTGTGVYSGPGTDAAGNFNPATAGPGNHPIVYTFTSSGNCVASVTSFINVSAAPSAAFTSSTAACLPANGNVAFTYTGTPQAGQTYSWNFGDPASGANNTSTLQNPSHNFPEGTFTIILTVTNPTTGCIDKDTLIQTYALTPAVNYPALTAVCENLTNVNVATATVTNGVPGTGVYSGNPGVSASGIFNPSVAGPGTHQVIYTFTSSNNCVGADTTTIVVNAKPNASFTYPTAACLPANGVANFTYNGSLSAGQTYLWNFGDPASGANNTSTLQNPSHTYTNNGTYTVSVQVTNANGCIDDSVINNINFSVTPALSYPPLTAVCENLTSVNVATATVTNGVTGTGVYSGPGTSANGIFNPSVAGPGTHTITYTFTSAGNCVEDSSQTIVVNAKPNASFTYPTAACLPANGVANFTYNGSLSAGQTYLWNFGDPASGSNNTSTLQNPSHTYTNNGTYTVSVQVTNANGCVDDSLINNINFSVTPALSYPPLAAVCENLTSVNVATATVTNGVTGTGVYSGPGTSANGTFNPSVAGPGTHTITYTFTSAGNCVEDSSQTIVVNAKPNASFTYPTAACLPATGVANFTYNGSLSAGQTYLWNFGDPASGANNTSTLQNPSHTYTNNGTYTVSVQVTNANGCVDDSVINNINFSVTPALSYPPLAAVCENLTSVNVATATVTNGVTGTGVYSGPGTSANGTFNPSVAGPGTHTITYTFTSAGNCVEDSSQTIVVNAKPNASFTYPTAACLPATGVANFTYNGSLSAGQTYLWNFGDPASGANNTSTLQNPSHTYTNTGTYSVSVTVTNSNGCVDDSVINNITFSVTPVVNYPALTAVCENLSSVNVATATVTNGVTGTGVYSGPGTSANGTFNPSVAGPGTHQVIYTFTSAGNCVAADTTTIVVNPKPVSAFTITPTVCQGQTATITSNATIPSGTITEWRWFMGDGNTYTFNNGNSFTHTYANYNTYQVKLVTVSANGCISDTMERSITVSPVPVAGFTMPASVCMPNGVVQFTNTSTIANNSALSYAWNFDDPASGANNTSTLANPTHVFSASSSYDITLTVTGANGCSSTISQTFDDFFDKPIAAFTADATEICSGTAVRFTDGSSAPNSTVNGWKYIFSDGSNLTQQNPTKTFGNAGTFTVRLVVTSAQGCVSDTSAPVTITVHQQPQVNAGPDFVVAQGTTIRFLATSNTPGVDILWSPAAGLSSATVLQPTHIALADAAYTVTLSSGNGFCTDTDGLTIKILRPLKIPNAFSPNGDNINDRWEIENLADYTGAIVEVFNRYGQMVWKSAGYATPWDGTTNGKPLPLATYYYVIQLKNGFKPISGSITIIR